MGLIIIPEQTIDCDPPRHYAKSGSSRVRMIPVPSRDSIALWEMLSYYHSQMFSVGWCGDWQ